MCFLGSCHLVCAWVQPVRSMCSKLEDGQKGKKPGDFSPSQPWITSSAVVMFPPWFVEDPGFVKTKAYLIWGSLLRKKEYKIRSRALEETQEGKEPRSISFVVNLCQGFPQVTHPLVPPLSFQPGNDSSFLLHLTLSCINVAASSSPGLLNNQLLFLLSPICMKQSEFLFFWLDRD